MSNIRSLLNACQFQQECVARLDAEPPEEATQEMCDVVSKILDPYTAKLVWRKMREAWLDQHIKRLSHP